MVSILVLKIYFTEINIQILINTGLDGISKGVLFGVTGVKIVDQDQVLARVYDPVFTHPGSTVFEQLRKIIHFSAASGNDFYDPVRSTHTSSVIELPGSQITEISGST